MRRALMVGWVVSAFIGMMMPTALHAEPLQCYPKAENFLFFIDQSGSMYQSHAEAGEIKEILAKDVAGKINATIPETGRWGGLYMFAPYEQYAPPALFWRRAIENAIGRIPDSQSIAMRTTPMGSGFDQLSPILGYLKGPTALIVFTDGADNGWEDPVAEARALIGGRTDVCLHVVSFADSDRGREINAALSKIGQGCLLVDGVELGRDNAKLQQFVRDIFCGEPVKPKRRIVLRGVNFDFDKSVIRPEGKPVLDEAITVLKEEPGITIVVEGHTDSIGTDAYNMKLSERRADAVADYLAAGGVSRKRMSTVGFGESKPVASNETEDGRAQNRRVEFKINQ